MESRGQGQRIEQGDAGQVEQSINYKRRMNFGEQVHSTVIIHHYTCETF